MRYAFNSAFLNTNPKSLVFKDEEFLNFVRKFDCLISHQRGRNEETGEEGSFVHHNWHARKNDYLAVPLSSLFHLTGNQSYHKLEHEEFCKTHNVNMEWVIINLLSMYIQHLKGRND